MDGASSGIMLVVDGPKNNHARHIDAQKSITEVNNHPH
jgi:hypothetical protein